MSKRDFGRARRWAVRGLVWYDKVQHHDGGRSASHTQPSMMSHFHVPNRHKKYGTAEPCKVLFKLKYY